MRSFPRKLCPRKLTPRKLVFRGAAIFAASGILLCLAAGQPPVFNGDLSQPPLGPPRPAPGMDPTNPFPPELQAKARKLRNEQRQKQIVSDTDKLLALANQLQSEIDRKPKNGTAPSEAKKLDDIERLARSVKEKMKAE